MNNRVKENEIKYFFQICDHYFVNQSVSNKLSHILGTLFLWVYWPSFNASPEAETILGQRAVITTVLSLSAATVCAFAMSSVLEKTGKFSMVW